MEICTFNLLFASSMSARSEVGRQSESVVMSTRQHYYTNILEKKMFDILGRRYLAFILYLFYSRTTWHYIVNIT